MDTLENGLQAELLETAPCCYNLKIVVPSSRVDKVYSDVLTKYIAGVRVPGFRAGHAPKALVMKSHGADIKADATQNVLREAVSAAVAKYDLRPATQIELKDNKEPELVRGQDLTIETSLEAFAKFDLPDYAGMPLENPEKPVDDKQVDEAMATFIRTNGTYQVVERAAAENDMVKVDYTTDADESLLADKSASYLLKGENSWMVLREGGEMLPGVIGVLSGLAAGDKKDAAISFPEDFRCEALRGKTVNFHFEVKEVHGFVEPELNEELFKRYGCSSKDEVVARIRQRMELSQREEGYSAMVKQATDKLLTMVDFPLPPTLVANESKEMVQGRLAQKRREKVSEEDLAQMLPQIEAECKAEVSKNIRLSEILSKIARDAKLEVSDYDIFQYCSMVAREQGADLQEVMNRIKGDRRILDNIVHNVTTQKGLNAVLSKAQITYTDPVTAAAKAAEAAAKAAEAVSGETAKNE